jgi:antitoxin component of RelBE/YafQ-DinJ toxin-antitoxin module
MSGKQSPMRLFIMMPMIFLMGKVDFENPMILNSARAAFFICQLLSLLMAMYIKKQIEAKNDTRKIYVPAASSPFDQQPNYSDVTETTYVELETKKVGEFMKQTLIGAAISSFIHFRMGVNHVVLIQAVMIPMNLYENPLVQAYIFGKREGRIWNEKLPGEPLEATPATSTTTISENNKNATKSEKLSAEEAIVKVWDQAADADFDALWAAVKDNLNAQTKEDQWTALMVACGSPIDSDDFISKVVKAGADVTIADGDGWTALHWSAFHDRPEAAEALLSAIPASKVAILLNSTAKDGRTPKELAESEENPEVAAIIEKYTKAGAKLEKKEEESELRRRKNAPGASSVEDVD